MPDVVYEVVIDLQTRGDLPGKAEQGISKLDGLDRALLRVGANAASMAGSLASAFESAVESAARLVAHAAVLGAGAAFAGITYGVLKLNEELERAQVGLA